MLFEDQLTAEELLEKERDEEILYAVLRCDVQKVNELLDAKEIWYHRIEHLAPPQITLCLGYIFENPEEWRFLRGNAQEIHDANQRMMDFWLKETEIDGIARTLECHFQRIVEHYADDSEEEILGTTAEMRAELKQQARQIDIDLYCAVRRRDFAEADRLLKQGANPEAEEFVEIDDSGLYINALDFVEEELDTGHSIFMFPSNYHSLFFEGKKLKDPSDFMHKLLKLAAHHRLRALLKKIKSKVC